MNMDAKLGALSSWRNGHTSLGPGFREGIDHNPTLSSSILGNANHNSILKYGQELNLYYSRNSSRSNSPVPYSDINQNTSTLLNFMPPNVLGNTGLNYTVNCVAATASLSSGSENHGSFRNSSLNCGSTFPISSQFGGSCSDLLGGRSFERGVSPVANTNVTTSSSGYEASYEDLFGDNSFYGDPTWQSSFSDLDVTGSLSYRLGNSDSDITGKEIEDYARGGKHMQRELKPCFSHFP